MTSPYVQTDCLRCIDTQSHASRVEAVLRDVLRRLQMRELEVNELRGQLVRDQESLRALRVLMRSGPFSAMPGWTCSCGCFNGTAKTDRKDCRACGADAPEAA